MTNRVGLYVAAGLLAVTAAAAVPVLAIGDQGQPGQPMGRGPRGGGPMGPGPGRGGPGMGMGPGLFGIPPVDLTDDQKQQVKTIVDSHKDQMRETGEKLRAAHEGMQALLEADTIDESAIRAKSVEVAAAEADAAILQAKVRAEIFQILTPEQQQKAKELRANRPQGRGGRGGPGAPGGGPGPGARPRQPGRH